MSRFAAKRTLSMEEYRRSMDGIYTTSVNEHTLDEAPIEKPLPLSGRHGPLPKNPFFYINIVMYCVKSVSSF